MEYYRIQSFELIVGVLVQENLHQIRATLENIGLSNNFVFDVYIDITDGYNWWLNANGPNGRRFNSQSGHYLVITTWMADCPRTAQPS